MRILFISTRPPWPSRRGDQARLAGWVAELRERHEVAVISQWPPGFPLDPYPEGVEGQRVRLSRWRMARSLSRAGAYPLQVAMHWHPALSEVVRREIAAFQPDVAVIVLSRLGWLMPTLRGIPVVLDLVDALSLNMMNRGVRQRWSGALWRWEGRRIGTWDRRLTREVSWATVVSERDKQALEGGNGEVEGRVRVVPFGIPLADAFETRSVAAPIVLLAGNLGYFPTRDGALWFASRVWPLVHRAFPRAQWWLAGSRAPRAVRRLARLPGVQILQDPLELSAIRRQAAVAIAPMRAGSGTPIKVLESMADGLPVVATPLASQGLDGLQGGEIAVARNPEAFAGAIVELLEDSGRAQHQAACAWRWLSERHDLRHSARLFEELLEAAAAGS